MSLKNVEAVSTEDSSGHEIMDFLCQSLGLFNFAQDSGSTDSRISLSMKMDIRAHVVEMLRDVTTSEAWEKLSAEKIKDYVQSLPDSERNTITDELFKYGVECLELFIQQNWVGPPLPDVDVPDMGDVRNMLSCDGDEVSTRAKHTSLLILARSLLHFCSTTDRHQRAAQVWLLHYVKMHQALLSDRSPHLRDQALQLCESISAWVNDCQEAHEWLRIVFHLQASQLMFYYYEWKQASRHLQTALELSGSTLELTGKLGRRTRYQQKEISQLVLEVGQSCVSDKEGSDEKQEELPSTANSEMLKGNQEPQPNTAGNHQKLPVNVALNDDTVLDQIQFSASDNSNLDDVSALQQLVVLAKLVHHRRLHEGQGDIVREESMAFISVLLSAPQSWVVQSTALYLRSMWEKSSMRRMQRSLAQLEELVNQYTRPDPPPCFRLKYLYYVSLPPVWEMEKALADMLYEIGAKKSALEVYLRIQSWEQVIQCYKETGEVGRAEEVIREQLQTQPSAALYIHLGDVTNDPVHYERAWEVSGQRSAHAQRALALYWLRRGEFNTSLTHFKLSLDLNPLQVGAWFSYGCAALACQTWDVATSAFRRCVTIDTDNFEAWNNLASAYMRMNNKERAHTTMQEALKCDYENWRLWENYLVVSVDIGEFSEGIRAYHRLLDLRGKHSDVGVLRVLVRVVNDDIMDRDAQPGSRLRVKLRELLGRITAQVSADGDMWRLYGELILGGSNLAPDDLRTGVGHIQKALRNMTIKNNWWKSLKSCDEVVQLARIVLQTYLKLSELESTSVLSTARLLVQPVIAKVQLDEVDGRNQVRTSEPTQEFNQLEERYQELKQEFAGILGRLKQTS